MRKEFMNTTATFGKIIFCCLLNLVCGVSALAQDNILKQEYSYRRYTISDGMPENACWDVFQDSKGYIWAATYSGFARYDGQQFISYWYEKQVNVQIVTENREGNICALSHTYYAVLDQKADTLKLISHPEWRLLMYASQNMPTGYFIYESLIEKAKALFLLSDTGLVKIWEHPCLYKLGDEARKPYWDKENRKFYIPTPSYIYIVNTENNTIEDSIVNRTVCTIFSYKKSIWGLGTDGIYKFENQGFSLKYKQQLYQNPAGLQAIADKENRLIIRDVMNLYRFDGEQLEHITDNEDFFDIIFDTENNMWAATYHGLINFFNLQFLNYTFEDDNNFPRALYADDEEIYIGTYTGRLYSIQKEKIKELTIPRTDDSYFQGVSIKIGTHLFVPGGYIQGGVLHYDGKKSEWLPIPYKGYYFLLPLSETTILCGAHTGIIIYDFVARKVTKEIPRSELYLQPNGATKDKNGRILIGGSGGITAIDGDSIYQMSDYLPENFISCRILRTDKNGKTWAASNNKLFSIDGNNVKHEYNFEHHIRGIIVTHDNLLIVLTIKGIHIKKPEATEFIYYDKNNGFVGGKIQLCMPAEDAQGNIWLLAERSVVRFNPQELIKNPGIPKLYIKDVMTSKDNINWKNVDNTEYEFGYQHNNIRFQYIGLHFSAVENVRYYYRLKGFQNNWSEPSKIHEITFNNLSPGDYIFEIYADAGTTDTRTEIQSICFSIKPALWQSTWFILLSISLLMFASAGVAISFQHRKNKALIEKLSTEKELNELRISTIRLKAIPHFNANVLAAIEYYIANRTKEEAMQILGIYSDFTFKTLCDVEKAARPLSEELAYVKMYLDLEKIRFLNKFDFQINVEENVDYKVQLPNMILHTYCENAVKHGLMPLKSGGILSINVSQQDSYVKVSVKDNGVGRAFAEKNKQMHSSKQGLTILNRQIEIYNQFNKNKIKQYIKDLLSDKDLKGTIFTIEVPVDYQYNN